MTAFERRLKQAEENAARQDAAAAKARRTVSTGLAKASTEKTGRATNAAGITTLPVFQGADGAFSGTGADRGTSSGGLKTGLNRGALTQERHAAATAGKTLLPGREKGIQMGFSQGLGYGTERAAAALLGAGENVTDLIGTGFYKGLQGITSLGGLAKNPVSEWAGREADAFLDNSVTRNWEEDIRARYQPTREEEQLTGLGQTVVQMLPAIATGSVAAKALGTGLKAGQAANAGAIATGSVAAKALGTGLKAGQAANAGANVSRAVFGLQAAGGGANEARQEGADAGRALAYGAASGLLETTIESIAGGIPGMGEGKLRGIAEAVKASPIVSRVLDIAGEGGEEALSAILSPYLKRAMYDPDAENATAEEIAQSALLGAAAAGVLQVGLELPGAVSDVRSARAEVGSGADILSRVNQRLAQPGQVAADFQGLPEFGSRFETLPSFRRRSVEPLPNFRQAQASVDTQGQNAVSDGAVEATGQNKTASTGETDVENETLMEKDSSVSQLQNEGTPSGRQEHGPSASGGGRNITVPFNGTPYRNDKSYRCVYAGESPISSEVGYGMFADDAPSTDMYGDDLYVVDHASLPSINDVKPAIAEAWDKAVEDWALPPSLDALSEYWSGAEIAEDFDPKNIIDGAGAWDNPDLVTWAFDNGLFDDIPGVKTSDGAIVWDAETVKRGDKNAEVWGQEDEPGQNIGGVFPKDSTGDAGTGLIPMTEQAVNRLSTGKKNIIARTAADIVSFVKQALGKKGGSERLYMGTLPETAAATIKKNTGVDVSGYTAILPGDSVQHIFNHHGDTESEAARGQRAVTAEDIALIPQVLASPDKVSLSSERDMFGRPVLLFSKQIGDTLITAQAVTDGRHALTTNSLWIKKGKNRPTIPDAGNQTGPVANVQNALSQGSSIDPIIRQAADGVNSDSAQGGRKYTDDGVGAANAGFAGAYHQLQNQTGEGGFHPDGEKAARQVDVPKRDFDGRNIPKSAATVLEAEATPDSAVDVIQEAIAKGEFSFDTITDEAALKRARTTVEEKGWDGAMEQFHQAAASGTVNKDNTALGQVLLNNAMNVGNSRAVIDLLSDYSTMSTTAAQALQANRMLKKLSPEGQLYAVQRSLSSYQEELRRRMGDKAPEITVEPALYQEFLDAQDQTGREAALEAIYKDVAGQVPANWMDKWNAWRYLAMLGNPRTHIRNIVGNAAFAPVRMVKNAIGTALEAGVDYLSPQGIQRTKAALNPASSTDRGLVKAALADVANVEAQLLGEGKYSESAPGKIRDYQSIFALEPLEALRKFTGTAMDVEDTWFSKPAYAWALAGYLKANGVDAQALNDGTVDARLMDQARAYAIREAQRATYRDSNAFSEFVSGLRRKGNSPVDRTVNVLMEGVLPFRKTPANILMRGVEYSPAGLVKGLTYDLRQVQQGKMEAAQAIDDIAAGLTGTGLLALGAWLASMGLVSGGGSGDDEQDGMDDLAGGQDYALSVGGKNYTLDWLAPEALPFFVGVELFNTLTDKSEGGVSWKNIEAAANRIMDPMLEMSMLQGLQDAIDNVRYADGGTLPKVAANAALSYLAQGVPTLFGQIERTLEDKRYTTYVDRTSGLPTDLQYTLGRTANKLPGEFQQVPYIDAWGRQEGSGSTAERAFNNFFNPAYVSRESETAAEREIKRLLDAGQSGVAPQRTSQSTQVTYQEAGSGETHKRYLTAEEYVDYASVKGQTSFELVSAMMESEIYKSMTDEQKADAIKLAYTYANHVASEEVTDGRHVSEAYVELAQAAKKELGLSEAEYLLLYKECGGSLVNGDKVREAYRQGMEAEEYLEYAAGAKGYNEDEKGSLTIAENAKAITQSGLSKGNQEIAWALAYPEWPEKAEEAGLSMAEYIQYKTATYGCKKKAEKLAALREAGLPVGWYYKVELCKAHVP